MIIVIELTIYFQSFEFQMYHFMLPLFVWWDP